LHTARQAGYQSILSMLTAAVFGQSAFYYLTIASIVLVLSFPANTPLPTSLASAVPSAEQLSSPCLPFS